MSSRINMSIEMRIKRIEKALTPTVGACKCSNVNKLEIWLADLGEESNSSQPWLEGKPIADSCARCGQRIEKKVQVLQLVDQTTKDRFPGEWNKDNK